MSSIPERELVGRETAVVVQCTIILEMLADMRSAQVRRSFRDTRLANLEERVMDTMDRWGMLDRDDPEAYRRAHDIVAECHAIIRDRLGLAEREDKEP